MDRHTTIGEIILRHGLPLMFVSRIQPMELLLIAQARLLSITTAVTDAILVQSTLPAEAIEIGMLGAFKVVESHWQRCGELLACQRCWTVASDSLHS